uniref:Uncharacterized protein n=1 Tax=Glossina pallidipes TaxID=7398 RepID=A0A1A9ZB54_GLOPL
MHIIKEENKDIDLVVVVSKLMPVDVPAAVYNVTMMVVVVVVVVVVDKVVIQWDWKRAMMTLDCVAAVDYCSYKDLMAGFRREPTMPIPRPPPGAGGGGGGGGWLLELFVEVKCGKNNTEV